MNTSSRPTSGPAAPSPLRSALTILRILNARLRFVLIMVVVGILAAKWETIMNYADRWTRRGAAAQVDASIEYFCPMHPAIITPTPSSCPLCGMPLSKRAKADRPPLPDGVLARVSLTPHKVRIGGIGTSPVEYRMLSREVRTVGIIDYDETRVVHASARMQGRLEKLFVNQVGQRVEKGDPLFSIYSPDLLVTQQQLIAAKRDLDAHAQSSPATREMDQSLYNTSRRKLLLLDITDEQIDEIIRRNVAQTTLDILSAVAGIVVEKTAHLGHYVEVGEDVYTVADLSNVWLQAKIFEDQIAGIQVGTAVEVTSTAYPNELFAGRITFIAFIVDPATRTVAARVEIANPDYRLRPGMYAIATIRLPVGTVTPMDPTTRVASTAPSTAPSPDEPIKTAFVRAYLNLAASYARDKTDTLPAFVQASKRLAENGPEDLREKAKRILKAAQDLTGKDLETQRKGFMKISTDVIALLRAQPVQQLKLYVAHCPMVEADWIQEVEGISNPYASYMPRCGAITGTIEVGGAVEGERYAAGYFCPIYPDRLFDKPAECPIDKFPMKYVRIEKTPAVPVSAVIDTGTRMIVYRESAPGVFDMIEVRLGARAGEFYPVVSGLSIGDRVATAGAFLVDAENRLNPGAAAQYFGATGNP